RVLRADSPFVRAGVCEGSARGVHRLRGQGFSECGDLPTVCRGRPRRRRLDAGRAGDRPAGRRSRGGHCRTREQQERRRAHGSGALGGGLGIRYGKGQEAPTIESFVGDLTGHFREQWETYGLPVPSLILEPGRSLVGRAGLTLYAIGAAKPVDDDLTYVAVDGGMSDNPRPQLYDATYSGILANRAGEEPSASYVVCGKHCESGDIMIRDLPLPEPRRGDLLAVPATGAYTLSMASNYNVVPRPAAVLVGDGNARLIRRRETLDDLLAHEV